MAETYSSEVFTQYARSVAHDVANPVNALGMHLELLEILVGDDERGKKALERARDDLDRIMGMLRSRLYLPDTAVSAEVERLDATRLVEDAARLAQLSGNRLVMEVEATDVAGSRSLAVQALTQVLSNAASYGEGAITCRILSGRIVIENGYDAQKVASENWMTPGISSAADRLGLGLPVALSAMQRFGGALELSAAAPMATVTLVFPVCDD